MSKLPGITRQDEEQHLKRMIHIAEQNLARTQGDVQALAEELKNLLEIYDNDDREGLAQWFNTDARYQEMSRDLKRMERTRKKPYFGRIDFTDADGAQEEAYYIGRAVIAEDASKPDVIDWRAPIASVYYEKSLGKCKYSVKGEGSYEIDLTRKRTYEIENDELKDFYDSDVVANDELLTRYLAKNKRAVLSEIIATIQQEQNEIIRMTPKHNVVVQGVAGSGKTTVAMHRISYILYNYELEFKPKDFYIIGSNRILLNYITGVLPDLDVYGVSQMVMEQLFVRLLYEDWDKRYEIVPVDKQDSREAVKGTYGWFRDLERFCIRYEWDHLPHEDVVAEKTGHVLMSASYIEKLFQASVELSFNDLKKRLNEYVTAKLENEIYGRDFTYSAEDKKALMRKYGAYFGREEFKDDIFRLYREFLQEQELAGKPVRIPESCFDVYDLAALAYLYKKLKETEAIQEASHVVIDEAQDYGMMVYGCLHYCLSKCTYTIMGDVSQNISFEYGLTDWEELKQLMLPDPYDFFGLLRKSYRNTVEISEYATNILQHGDFPVYPVEPIIRHGEEVRTVACRNYGELVNTAEQTIDGWIRKGHETIAVICKDAAEAQRVGESLGSRMTVVDFGDENAEFTQGVMVLPIEFAKGLEFDAVLLFDTSEENYPNCSGNVKLLYVAATRALHELVVLYSGTQTRLITEQLSEEKKLRSLVGRTRPKAKLKQEEPERTKAEIMAEQAAEGHVEMAVREMFGPRRIEAVKPVATVKKPMAAAKVKFEKEQKAEEQKTEFMDMPGSTSLRPLGHGKIDTAVKWVMPGKHYVDLTSAYGLLRITPVAADMVRVSFMRGRVVTLPECSPEIPAGDVSWNYRDLRDAVEITTEKVLVRVDKKSGAVQFYTPKGQLLLRESLKLPRQTESGARKLCWTYFDWQKAEKLKARDADPEQFREIGLSARYVSHGPEASLLPCIRSDFGYQLLVETKVPVLCCNVAAYGPYLHCEGTDLIDYYFQVSTSLAR